MTGQDQKRFKELERKLDAALSRMDKHSAYIMDEILPRLDAIERNMAKMLVSDKSLKEMQDAVVTLASAFYRGRTGKEIPRKFN